MTKATALFTGMSGESQGEQTIGQQVELRNEETGLRLYAKATSEGFRVWTDASTPAQVEQSGGQNPVIEIKHSTVKPGLSSRS